MSLNELITASLRDVRSTRCAALASGVIVLFDHLITLGDEIELVWRSHWSIGKILFIINRYYTLSSVMFSIAMAFSRRRYLIRCKFGILCRPMMGCHFLHSCHRFFQWQGWTGLIACMIAEVILQMRLYALYLLNKRVLALMVISFIICSASAATIMGVVLSNISTAPTILPGTSFCASSGIPDYFYTFWIPTIVFESLLCGLALFRGFQTFRSDGPLFSSGRQLVGILIRDSVFYFIVMFATYLTNLLVWTAAPDDLLEIPISFSVTFSCVMSNRIILNVRQASKNYLESKGIGPPDEDSNKPVDLLVDDGYVSDIEMMQLRSLRSEHRQPAIVI